MLFVALLGNLQRAAGREPEAVAGFLLQRREVKEQGGRHGDRLACLLHAACAALTACGNGCGCLGIPNALLGALRCLLVLLPGRIKPAALVAAPLCGEGGVHFVVGLRRESQDILLAGGEQGQRRRLHAPRGGDIETAHAALQGCERAGAVQAHQPVRFTAAHGSIGQVHHLLIGFEGIPGLQNRIIRHALHPEAANRLLDFAETDDIAENELTLAPGIACIHDTGHILAAGQLQHLAQAVCGFINGLQLHGAGHHGQVLHLPGQALAVLGLRFLLLHQVTHCRGDNQGVIGKTLAGVILLELT